MKFRDLQNIALWLHIPMWVLVGCAIVVISAYHTGLRAHDIRQSQAAFLPIMTLEQLTQIKVSEL